MDIYVSRSCEAVVKLDFLRKKRNGTLSVIVNCVNCAQQMRNHALMDAIVCETAKRLIHNRNALMIGFRYIAVYADGRFFHFVYNKHCDKPTSRLATKSVDLWQNLCTSILYFVVRVMSS